MSSQAVASTTDKSGPPKTKYYFAYGSNLHLKQMKRRCPNSKFIGCARLPNYRWQINERGYANIVEAEGHWVDGLVYEIDQKDEARLDVNEGVSKKAYAKQQMPIILRGSDGAVYRRPTAWIVDQGGPAQAIRVAKQGTRKIVVPPQQFNALVYISPNYIVDSVPKDEYVNRINLGLVDAQALGMETDYITNCIRPAVPKSPKHVQALVPVQRKSVSVVQKVKQPVTEAKGSVSQKSADASFRPREKKVTFKTTTVTRTTLQVAKLKPSATSKDPKGAVDSQSKPVQQEPPQPQAAEKNEKAEKIEKVEKAPEKSQAVVKAEAPPPLPPRPSTRSQTLPIIVIKETYVRPRQSNRSRF